MEALPDFITYSVVTRDFRIYTDKISDAGTYSLAAQAYIEVPQDHT